jgi:hypothetical protein
MTDNVRRITGPKPASLKPLSENDVARRVALNVALRTSLTSISVSLRLPVGFSRTTCEAAPHDRARR